MRQLSWKENISMTTEVLWSDGNDEEYFVFIWFSHRKKSLCVWENVKKKRKHNLRECRREIKIVADRKIYSSNKKAACWFVLGRIWLPNEQSCVETKRDSIASLSPIFQHMLLLHGSIHRNWNFSWFLFFKHAIQSNRFTFNLHIICILSLHMWLMKISEKICLLQIFWCSLL